MAGGICSVNVSKLLSIRAVPQSWSAVQWYAFAGFQNAVSNTYQYTDLLAPHQTENASLKAQMEKMKVEHQQSEEILKSNLI